MTDELTATLEYTLADWSNQRDCDTVVALLQAYALHTMGGGEPLDEYAAQNLPEAMAAMPGAFSIIGWQCAEGQERKAVALANCFTTLSTFSCKPLINIHDLYVADSARGRGTGQAMLGFVEEQARARGCCKVTLEVLTGNAQALSAYERFGFERYMMSENTGYALFMHKKLS